MHPPLEIRPPGLNVEAGFSRSKRHIIIFPVQRPSVSRHGLTLELRPPIRRLVSCRELITIYTGQRCMLYTANSSSVLINEKFGGGLVVLTQVSTSSRQVIILLAELNIPSLSSSFSKHWLCPNCVLPAFPMLISKIIDLIQNLLRSIMLASYNTATR